MRQSDVPLALVCGVYLCHLWKFVSYTGDSFHGLCSLFRLRLGW